MGSILSLGSREIMKFMKDWEKALMKEVLLKGGVLILVGRVESLVRL